MDISTIIRNKNVQTAAISVLTFAGGFGIGHIVGRRKVAKFERNYGDTYYTIEAEQPKETQLSVFDVDIESPNHDGVPVSETTLDPELETLLDEEESIEEEKHRVNVFTIEDADWDYEAELSTRTRGVPYIIHKEEFFENELGFTQETVTYYAGDDIMTDQRDTPVYNYLGMMGDLRFGHGSKDPTVVYIRNEELRMEWEVLLHTGLYSQEVLGLEADEELEDDELRHSYVPKFKRD